MILDPSKPPTTADRLATAGEILAAILLSPGAMELFKDEVVLRSATFPCDDESVTEIDFDIFFREDESIQEDPTVN